MVDVLHHIPNPDLFLSETRRVLRSEGSIATLEPWDSAWGARWIYRHLHSEPFEPNALGWTLPEQGGIGPLSGANRAIPWIIFVRVRVRFERLFPELKIFTVQIDYPFSQVPPAKPGA
jgi:hypothetical protein